MIAMMVDPAGHLTPAQVADPVAKSGEVVIQVEAAAVNRADLMQRSGTYPSPPGWPDYPGLEVAGTVIETSGCSIRKAGDKVCALLGGGGYAEKVAVPEIMTLPVPAGFSMAEAAAVPEVFSTAYLNFVMEANVRDGETVFIQAGASGLGIASVQLLKTLFDVKIITTVGSEEKAEFVRKLGADIVVNRHTDDLGKVLDEHPADIALDCVAGASLGKNLSKMNPWGRWIVIASLAGNTSEIDLNVLFRKRLRLIGSTLRSRTDEVKSQILRSLQQNLWRHFESGTLRPVIYRQMPLTQADQALEILAKNQNTGKIVLINQV